MSAIIASPYEDTDEGSSIGFRLRIGFGAGSIPLGFGVEGGGLFYGSSTTDVLVQTDTAQSPARLTREDTGVFLGFWLRLQPSKWFVRPYLEGTLGAKRLSTKYSLAFYESDASTELEVADWSHTIGYGLGFDVKITERSRVALGWRRLGGGNSTISREAEDGSTITQETATDISVLSLGFLLTYD